MVTYLHKTLIIAVKICEPVNICLRNMTGKYCTFKNAAASSEDKCSRRTCKGDNGEENDFCRRPGPRPSQPRRPGHLMPNKESPVHCRWSCTWRGVYPCSLPSQAESQPAPLSSASVFLKAKHTIKGRICHGHSRRGPGKRGTRDLTRSQPDYSVR